LTSIKPKSKPSGEHPAVKTYRAKLESVDRGVTAATSELDRALQEFLTDLKTPVPPKPTEETLIPRLPR